MQHIGKCEYNTNLRISTHRNDVWSMDGSLWEKHFQNPRHKSNEHVKFMIIQKINTLSLSKQQRRSLLEYREDFWMLKLETHSRKGLFVLPYILKLTLTSLSILNDHKDQDENLNILITKRAFKVK